MPEPFVVVPHVRDDHVDAFDVLDGEVEFAIGEQPTDAGFVASIQNDRPS
jgi:hypothetical protein